MYFIYVIGPKDIEKPQKIGISKNPQKRLKQLQTGHSEKLFIHYKLKCSNKQEAKKFEQRIHKNLKHLKTQGEWFQLSPKECSEEINYILIENNYRYFN